MSSLERTLARKYLEKKSDRISAVIPEEVLSEIKQVTYFSRAFYLVSFLWFVFFILLPRSLAMEFITMTLVGFLLLVTIEPIMLRRQGKKASVGPAFLFLMYLLILNSLDASKFTSESSLAQAFGIERISFGQVIFLSTWLILVMGITLKMIEWDALLTYSPLFVVTVTRALGIILMLLYLLFKFNVVPRVNAGFLESIDLIFLAGGITWIGSHFLGALVVDERILFQKEDLLDALSHSYSFQGVAIRVLGVGILSFFLQVLGILPRSESWNNLIALFTLGGIMFVVIVQSASSITSDDKSKENTTRDRVTRKLKELTPSIDEMKEKGVMLPKKTIELPKGPSETITLNPKSVIIPKELDDGRAVLTVLGKAKQEVTEKIKSKTRTVQVFKEQQEDELEQVEISIDELDVDDAEQEVVQVELSPEEWKQVKVELIKKKPEELDYQELGLDKLGIKSADDLQQFLRGFISKLQEQLSQDLESLLSDVLQVKESKYGVFSRDNFEIIRFPGITIIEKGSFTYLSILGLKILETKRGSLISMPFLKILETKMGEIIKLPFLTVIDLKKKGELVNILGFITINELKLGPDESLDEAVREVVNSFQITEEDFQPRIKRRKKSQRPKNDSKTRTDNKSSDDDGARFFNHEDWFQ